MKKWLWNRFKKQVAKAVKESERERYIDFLKRTQGEPNSEKDQLKSRAKQGDIIIMKKWLWNRFKKLVWKAYNQERNERYRFFQEWKQGKPNPPQNP